MASKRLLKEFKEVSQDKLIQQEGCRSISITDDAEKLKNEKFPCMAMIELELTAVYPSIYQNKKYLVNIYFSRDYPFLPPKVIFKTPIDHINICDLSGQVIHSYLKDGWSTAGGLRMLILELVQLFTHPRPQDLIDEEPTAKQPIARESIGTIVL